MISTEKEGKLLNGIRFEGEEGGRQGTGHPVVKMLDIRELPKALKVINLYWELLNKISNKSKKAEKKILEEEIQSLS